VRLDPHLKKNRNKTKSDHYTFKGKSKKGGGTLSSARSGTKGSSKIKRKGGSADIGEREGQFG